MLIIFLNMSLRALVFVFHLSIAWTLCGHAIHLLCFGYVLEFFSPLLHLPLDCRYILLLLFGFCDLLHISYGFQILDQFVLLALVSFMTPWKWDIPLHQSFLLFLIRL